MDFLTANIHFSIEKSLYIQHFSFSVHLNETFLIIPPVESVDALNQMRHTWIGNFHFAEPGILAAISCAAAH